MLIKYEALLLLSTAILSSQAAPSAPVSSWQWLPANLDGQYVTILNKAGLTALTVKPGDATNTGFQYVGGNHLQPQTISEGANQQWQLKIADKKANTWTLQNRNSSGWLEIDAGSDIAGKQVQAWGTRGTGDAKANQEWNIYITDNDALQSYVSLQNVKGKLWADLALNGNAYDGNPVIGWPWNKPEEGSAKWSFLFPDARAK